MSSEYYFAKIPKEYRERGITPNFHDSYYFRFRLGDTDQEVKFEDSCNRMIPIHYSNLKAMKKALKKVIKDIGAQQWR